MVVHHCDACTQLHAANTIKSFSRLQVTSKNCMSRYLKSSQAGTCTLYLQLQATKLGMHAQANLLLCLLSYVLMIWHIPILTVAVPICFPKTWWNPCHHDKTSYSYKSGSLEPIIMPLFVWTTSQDHPKPTARKRTFVPWKSSACTPIRAGKANKSVELYH